MNKKYSMGLHFAELQYRLILSIIGLFISLTICLFKGDFFLKIITRPYTIAVKNLKENPYLQAIHPADSFLVYLKTSLLFGFILASPWIFYQLWVFIAKGLYPRERKLVYAFLPFSVILFISGSIFFLYAIAPLIMTFLVSFNPGIDFVKPEFSFQSYTSFIILLTLVFGLSFELPIVIFILSFINILRLEDLKKARKYVLLALFIIAALLTPPDIISQIALALPMYVLFEISIVVVYLFQKKK